MNLRAIAVYLRVSTSRQDLRSQEPELQSWLQTNAADRPVVWYRDRHTGRSLDRPALGRLERDIIAGKVGTVVVWRNDRMGRRARQLLVFLEDLDERKIDYISVRDGNLTGDSASAKIFRHTVLSKLQADGDAIADADVRRLSPLVHKHLNFLGRYHFSLPGDARGGELRELRDPNAGLEEEWLLPVGSP